MAQRHRLDMSLTAGEEQDASALVDEAQPRRLQCKNSGSFSTTLPQNFVGHLDLEGGSPVQISLHAGGVPVTISEPCLIIRTHPEAETDHE